MTLLLSYVAGSQLDRHSLESLAAALADVEWIGMLADRCYTKLGVD